MKRKERFALSPFSSASMTSESFAPIRHPSCHHPGFGRNVRPVHLQALTLSGTPRLDGEGGLFLLEDLDVLHLYQLESHKPISAHKQVGGRYLPVIAHKRLPAHPGLVPHLHQSAVHLSETIYSSASSSPSRGSSRFPSRNKSSDLTARRTGRQSSFEDNHIRNTQIQLSRALQDTWKVLRAANRSNVHITMLYLGRGSAVPTQNANHQDELKVFQQICGAENICVYKGHLFHREQFQFVSRRHFGFPFSATIYVNGMVAARISWCCEHKYHAGFQQGKNSCFRLIGVRGGIPCHRCLMAQQYQRHRSKQTTEATQPGRNTDLTHEDERLEKGTMERSVLATSKSSLLKSDVGESKTAMIDGSYSNSNHKVLTSVDIPASLGETRRNSSQSCDVGQQNIKVESGYLLSESLNTDNPSQNLSSDNGGGTHKRNILMRRICQGVERMDNTEHSSQQINQESSSRDENTTRKLFENQRRFWKKGTLDAGGGSSNQESEDSSTSSKGRKVKKKTKRKRVRKWEAREEIEINGARFADHVEEGVRKKMWHRGRTLKKRGYLKDQGAVSVMQKEAVEDENNLSTLSGFLGNDDKSPDNNLNSTKGGKLTVQDPEGLLKDGIQAHNSTMKTESNVTPQVSIDKEPADLKQGDIFAGDLSDEHMEENLKGSHIKNTERLCSESKQQSKDNEAGIHLGEDKQIEEDGTPIDVSRVELPARVREKLASALKHAETIWSEPELSDTSEASGSEDWKESEDVKKNPAQERQQITNEEADEFGQLLANEQTKIKDAVHNNAALLAERKANEEAASSDSVLQGRTKDHCRMKPSSTQSGGSPPETIPQGSSNVEGQSSMDGLNGSQEYTCFLMNRTDVLGNNDIAGEGVSSQKLNVLKDEQNPLQGSAQVLGKSRRITNHQVSEDKPILTGSNFWSPGDLGCTGDPPWEHQLPAHCNLGPKDDHTDTKPGTCRSEDANYGNGQLLDKLVSGNEDDKAMLTGSIQGQWAVDTLRKQVADVITMLKVCKSVGELIMRNTGLTDDLLEMLVSTLINNSQSEVETINLNINNLGPQSAELLVELLKAKPSIKCLLLHGNNLGDKGISILMNGLIDLFLAENAEETGNGIQGGEQPEIQKKRQQLTELDIGSNQLTNEGLNSVASFLSLNPPLKYLGLSQNNAVDLTGWRGLFDILKDCRHISHVLLDDNVLRNEGAKYLAKVLCVNGSLCKVDLDCNEIGDEGGLALCKALSSNPHRSLRYLSLNGNELSSGVKKELNALLTENNQGHTRPYWP